MRKIRITRVRDIIKPRTAVDFSDRNRNRNDRNRNDRKSKTASPKPQD